MPISTALIIAAIVAMFIVFGVILAWADCQTRHVRPVRQHSQPDRNNDGIDVPPPAPQMARTPSKEFAGS